MSIVLNWKFSLLILSEWVSGWIQNSRRNVLQPVYLRLTRTESITITVQNALLENPACICESWSALRRDVYFHTRTSVHYIFFRNIVHITCPRNISIDAKTYTSCQISWAHLSDTYNYAINCQIVICLITLFFIANMSKHYCGT